MPLRVSETKSCIKVEQEDKPIWICNFDPNAAEVDSVEVAIIVCFFLIIAWAFYKIMRVKL